MLKKTKPQMNADERRWGRMRARICVHLRLSAAIVFPFLLNAAEITPQSYLEHVKYLSSDALKGRATGSPELEKAAGYIADKFKAAGLKPPNGKDYLQSFPVVTD